MMFIYEGGNIKFTEKNNIFYFCAPNEKYLMMASAFDNYPVLQDDNNDFYFHQDLVFNWLDLSKKEKLYVLNKCQAIKEKCDNDVE